MRPLLPVPGRSGWTEGAARVAICLGPLISPPLTGAGSLCDATHTAKASGCLGISHITKLDLPALRAGRTTTGGVGQEQLDLITSACVD